MTYRARHGARLPHPRRGRPRGGGGAAPTHDHSHRCRQYGERPMKSVTWNELDAQPALHEDLPTPSPGAGEVLVRVQASSINPVDNAIASGMLKDMVPHEFPVTLGRDF